MNDIIIALEEILIIKSIIKLWCSLSSLVIFVYSDRFHLPAFTWVRQAAALGCIQRIMHFTDNQNNQPSDYDSDTCGHITSCSC